MATASVATITMREELQETSADALFVRGEAKRLLARPKAQEDLEKIAKSERGDHRLRVLAHELFVMSGKPPDNRMIKVYSEALTGAFMHQWWGLPGKKLGLLGQRLVSYGELALPLLIEDMDNPALMTYIGPDAPYCRARKYCVGDLTTYIVCTILGYEYPDSESPEVRERSRIGLMKELTPKYPKHKRK